MPTSLPANPNDQPDRYNRFWFRALEIIPGLSIWFAILLPFVFAIYYPLAVTIFVLVFDVYWLQKSLVSAGSLFVGYRRMLKNLNTDWKTNCNNIEALSENELKEKGYLRPSTIYQAIILTTYKEEEAILESSIESIIQSRYPHERIFLVLATEERDSKNAREVSARLREKYGSKVRRFLVTEHPDGIVGEVKGKGANAAWAAHHLTKVIEEEGIAFERVIVSTADADSRFHSGYFDCLTYTYATTEDRIHCSYQPIATFLNNVWEAPMLSRLIAFATTFWQITESVQEYRLLTFSTHAMSLKTIVDIDYWCVSIVNEDSRQFFRAFFHYQGNFRAIPLFMPVYMDAVHVKNTIGTWKNLYFQQQRWAYGVEHFPYIVLESFKQKAIPFSDRFILIWRAFNGSFSWGTSAFFITVVGWLPIVLNNTFREEVAASNFPIVTSYLLTITWIGIIISNVVALKMLPPRPADKGPLHILQMIVMWTLVPISTIIFGAIPGIDAQTRLMLGKYMGFRVTEKKSVIRSIPSS